MSTNQERIHQAAIRLYAERGSDQLTIRELADAAGLARGTVYSHIGTIDTLFQEVTGRLVNEMEHRTAALLNQVTDPAIKVSYGIRFFLRRTHEDPAWGRFMNRFAICNPALQAVLNGPAMVNVTRGIQEGRFKLAQDQIHAALALIGGGTLTTMLLILEGHGTWRVLGSDLVELTLIMLGIPADEARVLARLELPSLPSSGQ